MVCDRCYDPIHPQEFARARPDIQNVPNARHVTTTSEAVFIDLDNPVTEDDL